MLQNKFPAHTLFILIFVFLFSCSSGKTEKDEKIPFNENYFESIIDGNYKDSENKHVFVFSNDDCGHCNDVKEALADEGIRFTVYDISDMNIKLTMRRLVFYKAGKPISYNFPVVVVGKEIFYSINDEDEFARMVKDILKAK